MAGDVGLCAPSRSQGFLRQRGRSFLGQEEGKDEGKREPRQKIREDIKSAGVDVEVYYDLEELLREKSLSSQPLQRGRADEIFKVSKFTQPILEKLKDTFTGMELGEGVISSVSGEVVSSAFKQGIVYEISSGSEYIEATYEIAISAAVEVSRKSLIDKVLAQAYGAPPPSVPLSVLGGSKVVTIDLTTCAEVDFSARVTKGSMTLVGVERVRIQQLQPESGTEDSAKQTR